MQALAGTQSILLVYSVLRVSTTRRRRLGGGHVFDIPAAITYFVLFDRSVGRFLIHDAWTRNNAGHPNHKRVGNVY